MNWTVAKGVSIFAMLSKGSRGLSPGLNVRLSQSFIP